MKTNKRLISQLLSQIIEISERKDLLEKKKDPNLFGESPITFHLKTLKRLIESESGTQ